MDKKRIFLIIGFLILVVILGFALWFVFFRDTTPQAQPTPDGPTPIIPTDDGAFPQAGIGAGTATTTPGETALPSAGFDITQPGAVAPAATVSQVVDIAVLGANPNSTGGANFYDRGNGLFYRVDENGRIQELSDDVFYNVENVVWSPTANESIIEYPDGSNIYYNFETKEQVTLPKHWEDFSFSPQGDKILSKSLGFSPENRWLVASNPDGTGVTPLEALGTNEGKVIVDWSPNQRVVALSRTGAQLGEDRQELLFVGQHGENFPSVIVEGRGLETQWSNKGEKLLYSVYNARSNFRPELWVVNSQIDTIGADRRLLNINTWADKCAFENDRYVLCGVPTSLDAGSGFAPALADQTPDQLFRIDTQTGIRTQIPLGDTHTIDSIFYNEQEGAVYFTDKNKAGLFQARL